jgi:hypothetical protein
MSEGSKGSVRASRARLWALALAVLASAGCIGPGLEPPWSEDEPSSSSRNAAGPGLEPPVSMTETGSGDDGDFGNAMSGGGAGSAATGGDTGAQPMAPVTPPPAASAGSGAVEEPPAVTPDPMTGTPSDPAAMAGGAGGSSGFTGFDFVPGCDSEQPSELTSVEACRYALPDALAGDLAALRLATLDAGTATTLVRGDSAVSCLFGSDYYVDVTSAPAAVVLCSQACGALAASAQLVAIAGCPPSP